MRRRTGRRLVLPEFLLRRGARLDAREQLICRAAASAGSTSGRRLIRAQCDSARTTVPEANTTRDPATAPGPRDWLGLLQIPFPLVSETMRFRV
jgi:hypothetical protein